jgi:UDP-N-acetylmuramoyl-tripeptide--D-alanyl-D-alanine ligase
MLTLAQVLEATRGQLYGRLDHAADVVRFSRIVVDSRQVSPGTLFVALKGERHDGHDFVAQTLQDGALAALVEHVPDELRDHPQHSGPQARVLVVVPSTVHALADMARYAFNLHPDLKVIGVTGSIGKTTTKEVLASVLSTRKRVLKSEGNLNSEIGLPMTVVNGLSDETPAPEVAVLEMAMYQVGDIRYLARLARPYVGIVTSVMPVHLGRLGTIERIQEAKQELVEELPSDGLAVLNADDQRVACMASATAARTVRYGVSENAEVRAEHIESQGLSGVHFDVLHGGQRQRVHLPLLGAHNVYPALAATAVALEEGLSLADVAGALEELSPTLRLLVVDGINGSRIVDDSYNANPESVIAALTVLDELPGARKIGVLGDMLELGSEEVPAHRRVGKRAAEVLDVLIAYGPRSKVTADQARQSGLRADQVIEPHSHAEIVELLREQLQPGDDVLVKGSLNMGMSAVVRGIRAESEGV